MSMNPFIVILMNASDEIWEEFFFSYFTICLKCIGHMMIAIIFFRPISQHPMSHVISIMPATFAFPGPFSEYII